MTELSATTSDQSLGELRVEEPAGLADTAEAAVAEVEDSQ